MKFEGSRSLAASRSEVWRRLDEPLTLRQCIPGCESLEREGSDGAFKAVVTASVGPVRARFVGSLTRSDVQEPVRFRLEGQGQGGMAGFGKMTALVELEEQGAATTLRYTCEATVGGKLAQVGSRLVAVAAEKFSDEFFDRFESLVGPAAAPAAPAPIAATGPSWWQRLLKWLSSRRMGRAA